MVIRFIVFLLLNFVALAIGSLSTMAGVTSNWYATLNKAPWTPPGWVFGAAWTFIMICFAVYMSQLWAKVENKKKLLLLYALQWILNVSWNPIFFKLQFTTIGLIVITALTILVLYLLFYYKNIIQVYITFILPYGLWLLIATSLNAYICWFN